MIVELSRHFLDFRAPEWQNYHLAIENLITAHGQGWHIFSPGRDIGHAIHDHCQLSGTQIQIIKYYIIEKFPVLVGQARTADHTILCFPDGVDMIPERLNQISVRLSSFRDLAACGPSRLITENSDADGSFLELIARGLSDKLGYSMKVNIEHVHGGGGTTFARYEGACQSNRPTLCVVDSDKKYEDCGLGSTARRVRQVQGNEISEMVRVFTLPVRELENAIPISTLFDVYAENSQVRRAISSLTTYIEDSVAQAFHPPECLKYIDLKVGLKRSDIAKMPNPSRANFVRFSKCVNLNERQIQDYEDTHDHTLIHPGIAVNMLNQVVAFLQRRNANLRNFLIKLMRSPCWEWLEALIRLILSYGAATQRIPIR